MQHLGGSLRATPFCCGSVITMQAIVYAVPGHSIERAAIYIAFVRECRPVRIIPYWTPPPPPPLPTRHKSLRRRRCYEQ